MQGVQISRVRSRRLFRRWLPAAFASFATGVVLFFAFQPRGLCIFQPCTTGQLCLESLAQRPCPVTASFVALVVGGALAAGALVAVITGGLNRRRKSAGT